MFCQHCGKELEAESKFCSNCGTKREEAGEASTTAAAEEAAKVAVSTVTPRDRESRDRVSAQQPVYISSHVLGAVFTLIVCAPLGLVSVLYAVQVAGALEERDYRRAKVLSSNAATWMWCGIIIGAIFWGWIFYTCNRPSRSNPLEEFFRDAPREVQRSMRWQRR